jgi:hypothetical protein
MLLVCWIHTRPRGGGGGGRAGGRPGGGGRRGYQLSTGRSPGHSWGAGASEKPRQTGGPGPICHNHSANAHSITDLGEHTQLATCNDR